VTNAGQVDPNLGSDPTQVITVQGNYQQLATGSLLVDLGGPAPDTGYDQLNIIGGVTLGGSLTVRLMSGFTPVTGNTSVIINGDGIFGDASGVSPTLTWSQLQALGITDGPSQFPVQVRVDDGNGHAVDSPAVTLTVTNVAPTATLSNKGPVNEASPATVSFSN